MHIDHVGPDGWQRVRTLRLRALADAPDAFWMTLQEERAKDGSRWLRQLARRDAATFIAHEDGRDAGLAVGAPHHEHAGDAGLYAVWVAPEARGRRVGELLISAVIDWARSAGYQRLRLDVGDSNEPAVRLYARHGFRPTGTRSRFPPPRDHITEHERALDL